MYIMYCVLYIYIFHYSNASFSFVALWLQSYIVLFPMEFVCPLTLTLSDAPLVGPVDPVPDSSTLDVCSQSRTLWDPDSDSGSPATPK